MKKAILYVFLVLAVASCSMDDTALYAGQEIVPIESVNIPDTLDYGQVHDFEITYARPTDCHTFDGFSYERDENERIIWVVNRYYYEDNTVCNPLEDQLITKNLQFEVVREDFYIFNFWQGVDEDGENIFLTVEVPVRTE